jgi:hypothetical protein
MTRCCIQNLIVSCPGLVCQLTADALHRHYPLFDSSSDLVLHTEPCSKSDSVPHTESNRLVRQLAADACCIGAMANAAFYRHYPLPERFVQNRAPMPQVMIMIIIMIIIMMTIMILMMV